MAIREQNTSKTQESQGKVQGQNQGRGPGIREGSAEQQAAVELGKGKQKVSTTVTDQTVANAAAIDQETAAAIAAQEMERSNRLSRERDTEEASTVAQAATPTPVSYANPSDIVNIPQNRGVISSTSLTDESEYKAPQASFQVATPTTTTGQYEAGLNEFPPLNIDANVLQDTDEENEKPVQTLTEKGEEAQRKRSWAPEYEAYENGELNVGKTPEMSNSIESLKDDGSDSAPVPKPSLKSIKEKGGKGRTGKNVQQIRDAFTGTRSRMRFAKSLKSVAETFQRRLKRKAGHIGSTFMGTLHADRDVPINAVCIGSEDIIDMLRNPDSQLLDMFNYKRALVVKQHLDSPQGRNNIPFNNIWPVTDENGNPYVLSLDNALNNIPAFCRELTQLQIEAVINKDPVNQPGDIHRCILMAKEGRGLGLHPLAAKMMNADFDSDTAVVNFNKRGRDRYRLTSQLLVNIDSELAIDLDFFPVIPIPDDFSEANLFTAIREDWPGFGIFTDAELRRISDSYYRACKLDNREKRFKEFLFTLEHVSNAVLERYNNSSRMGQRARESMKDDIICETLELVYEFSRYRADLALVGTIGLVEDYQDAFSNTFNVTREEVHDMPPLIQDIIEEIDYRAREGRAPISFMEFEEIYSRYYGSVRNKNVAFRTIADVLKQLNRTDLINVGDPYFDLQPLKDLDPEKGVSAYDMYKITCSMQMAVNMAGKSALGSYELNIATLCRTKILEEAGMPGTVPVTDENGNTKFYELDSLDDAIKRKAQELKDNGMSDKKAREQASEIVRKAREEIFRSWVYRFEKSYNKWMRMCALSNVEVHYGQTIKKDGTKYYGIDSHDDLAMALSRVYGDFAFEKIFGPFLSCMTTSGDDVVYVPNPSRRYREENGGLSVVLGSPYSIGGDNLYSNGFIPYVSNMTLNFFIMHSEFRDAKSVTVFENGEEREISGLEQRQSRMNNNTFTPMDVAISLSDRRSRQNANYRKTWMEYSTEIYAQLVDVVDGIAIDKKNGKLSIGKIPFSVEERLKSTTSVLNMIDHDMFEYFNMDNPAGFAESFYGEKLLRAALRIGKDEFDIDNAEDKKSGYVDPGLAEFRNVLIEMEVEFRLRGVTSLEDEIANINESIASDPTSEKTMERLDVLCTKLEREKNVLASCSPVWAAIVHDINSIDGSGVTSNLQRLKDLATQINMEREQGRRKSTVKFDMNSIGFVETVSTDNILDILLSDDVSYQDKENLLSDMARQHAKMDKITSREVLGMLSYDPDPIAAGNRFDMYQGLSTPLNNIKESRERLSYAKSKDIGNMREAFQESFSSDSYYDAIKNSKTMDERERIRRSERDNQKVGFMNWLEKVSYCPEGLYVENRHFTCDAIAAVYTPTYDDTEKIRQQIVTMIKHAIECVKRNGGFLTHLFQSNSKPLNMIGPRQFSEHDIAMALADPSLKLTYYDEYGRTCEVSRASICGGNTIQDVADFLFYDDSDNLSGDEKDFRDRIMLCLRKKQFSAVGNNSDNLMVTTNAIPTSSMLSYRYDTMTPNASSSPAVDAAWNMLSDRPRFQSILALFTRGATDSGKHYSGRQMAERLYTNSSNLIDFVIGCAFDQSASIFDDFNGTIDERHKDFIKDRLSIDPEKINSAAERLDVENEMSDDPLATSKALYESVVTELAECVQVIRSRKDDLIKFEQVNEVSNGMTKNVVQKSLIAQRYYDGRKFQFDEDSVIAYYHTLQHFSGARTADMINIEGAETKKNILLNEMCQRTSKDIEYITVSALDSYEEIMAIDELLNTDSGFEIVGDQWNNNDVDTTGMTDEEIERMKKDRKTLYDILFDNLDENDSPVIVIKVPEGWAGRSDSTLYNIGNDMIHPVSKFLQVKRDKGAEAFNAKTKKYGDDPKNSITKFFKYANSDDVSDLMDAIQQCDTKEEAVVVLAEALMKYDRALEYDSASENDPALYFNLANFMIAENSKDEETGQFLDPSNKFAVRSLEQLSTALNYRLPDEVFSYDTDRKIVEAGTTFFDQLVDELGTDHDPMQADPDEILKTAVRTMRIPNQAKMSSKLGAERAFMSNQSSSERNFEQLNSVVSLWEQDNGRFYKFRNRTSIRKQMYAMFKDLPAPAKKAVSVLAMTGVSRGYDKNSGKVVDKFLNEKNFMALDESEFDKKYDFIGEGHGDLDFLLGPSSTVLFYGEPNAKSEENIAKCERYGVNAIFGRAEDIPEKYRDDVILVGSYKHQYENDEYVKEYPLYMVPFWDMMMNGSISAYKGPAPAQMVIDRSWYSVSVKETVNEHGLGDSDMITTREHKDKINFNPDGDKEVDAYGLFNNFMSSETEAFLQGREKQAISTGLKFMFDVCDKSEVEEIVTSDTGFDKMIDIGVVPENRDTFVREFKRLVLRIAEYRNQFQFADGNGNLTMDGPTGGVDLRNDSIIGWAKCTCVRPNGSTSVAYAPIVAFHADDTGMSPSRYKVQSLEFDPSTSSYRYKWVYTGTAEGQIAKGFDGAAGASKYIINSHNMRPRSLANGLPIEIMFGAATVSGRSFLSNERIRTMHTLYMMPHIDDQFAFNIAEHDEFLPYNADPATRTPKDIEFEFIKKGVLNNTLTDSDWEHFLNDVDRNGWVIWEGDKNINDLIKNHFIRKSVDYGTFNPTYFLATKFVPRDVDLSQIHNGFRDLDFAVPEYPTVTEFEMFAETGANWQNAYMNFMSVMAPGICPSSIDGDSSHTLFKPVNNVASGEYGILQMEVPHYLEAANGEGGWYTVNENVYICLNYYGTNFSGFRRTSQNSSQNSIDQMSAATRPQSDKDTVTIMEFARRNVADFSNVNSILNSVEYMQNDEPDETQPIEEDIEDTTLADEWRSYTAGEGDVIDKKSSRNNPDTPLFRKLFAIDFSTEQEDDMYEPEKPAYSEMLQANDEMRQILEDVYIENSEDKDACDVAALLCVDYILNYQIVKMRKGDVRGLAGVNEYMNYTTEKDIEKLVDRMVTQYRAIFGGAKQARRSRNATITERFMTSLRKSENIGEVLDADLTVNGNSVLDYVISEFLKRSI